MCACRCGFDDDLLSRWRLDRKQEKVMALGDPRLLPDKYIPGLIRWIKDGIEPGHFIRACLKNDLLMAIGRADQTSLMSIEFLIGWLAAYAPDPCWGSEEKYEAWKSRGGMPEWDLESWSGGADTRRL